MINGTSSEPSTWAMMILGFCRVDFSAYRQKRNGAAYKQPLFISRVAALATSMILMAWGGSKAQTTQNVDMTTLTPAYLSNSTGYVSGELGPGYSHSATTNQLIITGTNLPVQSNSFAVLPGSITGDFTATVQSFVTNMGGTNFSSNTPLGYTEVGTYSSGGIVSTNFNYGASGSQIVINGPSASSQIVTEQLSRMGDTLTGSVTVGGRQTQIFSVFGFP